MIVYGSVLNKFSLYSVGTNFTLLGAIKTIRGPESSQTFPIYGAVLVEKIAPIKINYTGAIVSNITAGNKFTIYGPVSLNKKASINISGLSIENIAVRKVLPVPSLVYNIYPYLISDVKKILGTDLPYEIVGNNLIFSTEPEGSISLVLFNRLNIYSNSIRKLTLSNLIPTKAEFRDITVSGDFLFSLNSTGPWTNRLNVIDTFYVKAPNITQIGSNYTQEFTVEATIIPIG
jgi:hypothetical protein